MEVLSNKNIEHAVNLWDVDKGICREKYGDISTWDVSRVTKMEHLFDGKDLAGWDLSNWDVSNVKSMKGMFHKSYVYLSNGIQNWIPKNLENCEYMFCEAHLYSDYKFTFNPLRNKKKIRTYGMFNQFTCFKNNGPSTLVEVDTTFWESDNIDQDNCYGMFGGKAVWYSKEYLSDVKLWLLTEFPRSEKMVMKRLFINEILD
jgi:hypothetical protein